MGLQGRENSIDDIFIRIDTIPACDGSTDTYATTAIAALTHSVARLKKTRR